MDQVLRRKINLLIHLANADGHFDVSEKAFIKDLLTERGIDHRKLENFETAGLEDIHAIVEKEQVLYWSLQLIKADGTIQADEIAFCKAIAFRLKFLPEVIDAYVSKELPEFTTFKKEVDPFRTFTVRD
jgi:uncharacterized membrane protein YebE (DUF533 family)